MYAQEWYVSLHLICYNKNTQKWVAYEKYKFIPHSSEIWESKIRVSARLGKDPLLGCRVFVVSLHDGKGKQALGISFVKALIPGIHEGFTLVT